MATEYNYDFLAFYAAIGVVNCAFLIIYVLINLSKLMKFSTRSIEEIFGFFITCSFCKDAFESLAEDFEAFYVDEQHVVLETENESANATCTITEEMSRIPDECLIGQTNYATVEFHTSRDKALLAIG